MLSKFLTNNLYKVLYYWSQESGIDPFSVPSSRTGKCFDAFQVFFTLMYITQHVSINIFIAGYLRVNLKFNVPPKRDLILMMVAETTELMTIDSNNRVQMSYRDMVPQSSH